MDNTSNNNKKSPKHKVHRYANKFFIVIDDTLVKLLSINEQDTWMEQDPVENGIVFKIQRLNSSIHKDDRK